MTFDSKEEAQRIRDLHPAAQVVLRIAVEDTDAPNPMGKKFGAGREQWSEILDTCQALSLPLRGISFHVGSGGCSYKAYEDSVVNAMTIFEMAADK